MSGVPRVSVCVITYRHERFIEQAIRSVLEQETSFPVEIVVGEDASPDRTANILQRLDSEFPGRLTLLLREENLGMQRNARDTFARCRGEFVAFLEGDDYWIDPHKLQRQVDALDQHPGWSGCFHPAEYVNPNGKPLGQRHPPTHLEPVTFDDLCRQNCVQTCSLMVRKAAVPNIPDWVQLLPIGDWAICLIATTRGPLGMLPECMACYRVHPGGVWTSQSHRSRFEGFLRAYTTIAEHLPPEYTLRLMRGQRYCAETILIDRDTIANSVSYRLGNAILSPIIWCYREWQRRRALGIIGHAAAPVESPFRGRHANGSTAKR
jgi:glycosyltransferase involved in cell wall biosynthesis